MSRLSFTDLTDIHSGRKIWENERSHGLKSLGVFVLKESRNDFYLYGLDEFDTEFHKDIKLRANEKLYRYETKTSAIGGFFPIIKINLKSGLVYFQKDLYSEVMEFETISAKPMWINLNSTEKITI